MRKNWPYTIQLQLLIGRHFERFLLENLNGYGLNASELFILVEAYRLGGECEFDELGRSTYVSRSTISRRIDALEKDGYVQSFFFSSEKKSSSRKKVKLEPKGLTIAGQAIELLTDYEKTLLKELSEEEKNRLADYVKRFYLNSLEYNNLKFGGEIATRTTGSWPGTMHYFVNNSKLMLYISSKHNGIYNLVERQKMIMLRLLYNGRETKFKELERALYYSQQEIARHLAEMKRLGLVETLDENSFKKGHSARLTREGADMAEYICELLCKGEREICLKGFSKEESKDLTELLQRITQTLQ